MRCEALVGADVRPVSRRRRARERAVLDGAAPATPSNVPLVGRTRYRNLYLNTGHGTLGWTMACGSGARSPT